jgi:hypothetical protein
MRTVVLLMTFAMMVAGVAVAEDNIPDIRTNQQAEALGFVKQCVGKVKRRDSSVLRVITDANILVDLETELKKQGDKSIEWDKMFGELSKLTDEQIAKLDTEVLLLRQPVSVSKQVLTDKRQQDERKVEGIYMRFEANIAPQFWKLFNSKQTVGFGVYIIEGKYYWEPFGW